MQICVTNANAFSSYQSLIHIHWYLPSPCTSDKDPETILLFFFSVLEVALL